MPVMTLLGIELRFCTREVSASNLGPKPVTKFLVALVSPSEAKQEYCLKISYGRLFESRSRFLSIDFSNL